MSRKRKRGHLFFLLSLLTRAAHGRGGKTTRKEEEEEVSGCDEEWRSQEEEEEEESERSRNLMGAVPTSALRLSKWESEGGWGERPNPCFWFGEEEGGGKWLQGGRGGVSLAQPTGEQSGHMPCETL